MFSFGHKKSTSPPAYTNTNLPTPSSSTNNNDAANTTFNRSSSQNRLSFTRADNGFEIVDSLPRTSSFSSSSSNNDNNNSNRRNSSSSSSRNLNRNSSDSSLTPTTTELEIVVFKDGYEEQLLQKYEREEMERIQLEKDEEVRLKQLDDDRIMAKEMQSRLRMEHMQEQAQQLSNSMSSPSIDDDGGIVSDTVPSSSSSPVATIRTPTPTMSAADSYMGSNGSSPTTMMNEQYRRKSLPPVPQKRDSLTSPASMVHQASSSPNSPHFSTDQVLMQYLSLVELGHEPSRCKFAVEAYRGDRIQTLDCISKLNQLVSWGFPEQRAREAILLCDRDLNQCLDYLSKLQQQDNQSHHLHHHQTPPPSSTTGGSYPSYADQSHASMNSSIMMDSMTNSGMYNPPPSSTLPFPSYPQQPYGSATSYPPPPTQYPPYGRGPYGY